MRYILVVLCFLYLSSCSILLNGDYTDVYIYSNTPVTIAHFRDSIKVDSTNRAYYEVYRSDDLLPITANTQTSSVMLHIEPKLSPSFYSNIFLYPGFVCDLTSVKRYKYENHILLNDDMTINTHPSRIEKQKWKELKERLDERDCIEEFPQQGDFLFNITVPFVLPSHTLLSPQQGDIMSRGSFLGFGFGFDYYYKKDRFFNLSSSATFGGDIQIGCGDWGYDDETRFNVYNISVSHNHRYNRFTFGYGLSYMYNDWWRVEYKPKSLMDESGYALDEAFPPARYYEACRYSTLGLTLNTYYLVTRSFNVGITYRPQFLRLSSDMPSRFRYEHQISLDIAFKATLFK